ncbi:hypothetical protein FH972_024460 [Carpinus fangiana]|uniref:GOLD domain-containing protein n=1 Tax=Carpinus fangiana TaxID=176857 RepID=A0A5N6L0L7_9ROSI|nr:hypothetical protein FH972_024460 [Carpinus fangiana]
MRVSILITALLTSLVSATSLTYKFSAGEKACFYAWAETAGSKVAFYFAVQSGGSFDIDYSVYGPKERLVLDGDKERQGDFVFTANDVGEYRFCFDNSMSTTAEKTVDFEISVCRKRIPRTTTLEAGRSSRANFTALRVYLQAVRPAQYHHSPAEVLPHPREPQLQYRPQHRGPHLPLFSHREWFHSRHGGVAGVCREILLHWCKKGLCVNAQISCRREETMEAYDECLSSEIYVFANADVGGGSDAKTTRFTHSKAPPHIFELAQEVTKHTEGEANSGTNEDLKQRPRNQYFTGNANLSDRLPRKIEHGPDRLEQLERAMKQARLKARELHYATLDRIQTRFSTSYDAVDPFDGPNSSDIDLLAMQNLFWHTDHPYRTSRGPAIRFAIRSIAQHNQVTADPHTLSMYCDGAKFPWGAGAAVVVPALRYSFLKRVTRASTFMAGYDEMYRDEVSSAATELFGVVLALEAAATHAADGQRVAVFCDAQGTVDLNRKVWAESNGLGREPLERALAAMDTLDRRNIKLRTYWLAKNLVIPGAQLAHVCARKAAHREPGEEVEVSERTWKQQIAASVAAENTFTCPTPSLSPECVAQFALGNLKSNASGANLSPPRHWVCTSNQVMALGKHQTQLLYPSFVSMLEQIPAVPPVFSCGPRFMKLARHNTHYRRGVCVSATGGIFRSDHPGPRRRRVSASLSTRLTGRFSKAFANQDSAFFWSQRPMMDDVTGLLVATVHPDCVRSGEPSPSGRAALARDHRLEVMQRIIWQQVGTEILVMIAKESCGKHFCSLPGYPMDSEQKRKQKGAASCDLRQSLNQYLTAPSEDIRATYDCTSKADPSATFSRNAMRRVGHPCITS